MEAKIEEGTRQKIVEINHGVQRQQEQALSRLLALVYDVKAEMHINYKA